MASCNDSTDLMTRDKQVWGEEAHPEFLSSLDDKEVDKVRTELQRTKTKNYFPCERYLEDKISVS